MTQCKTNYTTIETEYGDILRVEERLVDITLTLNNREFYTKHSCVNERGEVSITLSSIQIFVNVMKKILKHHRTINRYGYIRYTLWDFILHNCDFIRTKKLDGPVKLIFPLEELSRFKKFFFEVFPKDISNEYCLE